MLERINTLMILVSQAFLVRYIYAINKGIEQLTKENLILIEKTRVMQELNNKLIEGLLKNESDKP